MHLVCSAAGAQSHTRAGTFCGRLRRGRYGPEPHLLLQAPPRDRWSLHYLSVRVLERITKVPVQTVMPGSRRPLHPWKSQPRWPYSASLLTRVATASNEASCTSRSSAVTRSAVRPSSAAPACRQNCTGSLLPASTPMRVRNMLSRRGNATALRSLSPVTVPLWVNPLHGWTLHQLRHSLLTHEFRGRHQHPDAARPVPACLRPVPREVRPEYGRNGPRNPGQVSGLG
jgi:hypothetical protein